MAPKSALKLSLLLLQLNFGFVVSQHGASHSVTSEKAEPVTIQRLPAPVGCNKLSSDADWPSLDVVNKELPGWEKPEKDGNKKHPDYIYEVKTVASVQRAVKFATKHKIRLSIINSGHDFLGRNDAPSGVLLNVAGLKGARVLESFEPSLEGAEPVDSKTVTNIIKAAAGRQTAVTFGGGMTLDELNRELRKSGLYTIGAAHGSVSVAGGWSQAGGHAWLSSEYGLGADNMLEYKVITADGNLTVANAKRNPDLFWAMRGGGAGTWGVAVEATMKAYPVPTILSYNWFMNTTDYTDRKSIIAPATYLHRQFARMNRDGGFQGYVFIHPNAIHGQLICPNKFANATNMQAIMSPILEKMISMPGMDRTTFVHIPPLMLNNVMNTATTLLQTMFGTDAKKNSRELELPGRLERRHGPGGKMVFGMGIYDQDSRLLGEKELNDPKLADVIERAIPYDKPDGQIRVHLTAGGKVNEERNDTSVHPSWRKAIIHNVSTGGNTPVADSWRELAPDMGAYVNEAWIKNPDWKKTFWGPNYPKLSAIKKKWDPDMVFYVTPGVNADHMIARDGRLCKVEGPVVKMEKDVAPLGDNRNDVVYNGEKVTFPMLYDGKGKPPIMRPLTPKSTAKSGSSDGH